MRRHLLSVCAVLMMIAPAHALEVIWVSDAHTPAADAAGGKNVDPAWAGVEDPWDQGWVDALTSLGHNVNYEKGGYWKTLDDAKVAALNAADLIVVSRDTNSGDYANGDEETVWNSITTPIVLQGAHIARRSRWKWVDSTTIANACPLLDLPGGPTGIPALDPDVGRGLTSFVVGGDAGNGEILATVDAAYPDAAGGGIDGFAGSIFVAQWLDTSQEFYAGAGQSPAGPRLLMYAGTWEGNDDEGVYWGQGMYNLTPFSEPLFVDVLATIPEPATVMLLGLGAFAALRKRRV